MSHDDRDQAVRDALAGRGDDGSGPRHTLFFLYEGDQAGLRAAAVKAGFSARGSTGEDGEEYGSVLEITAAVDEASFAPLRAQMELWADEFGAVYDGWECAVVTN